MDQFFRELNQQITFMHSIRLDFPSHFHEDIELVYVKNGGGTAFCDGKPYILSKNSFFLVFPNQVHRYVQCSGSEYILLVIKPSKLLANSDIFEQKHPTSALLNFREQSDDNLSSLLEMALTEFERDGHNTVINAYLTAFFEKLLPFYTFEDNGAANDTASQILRYCSEHYRTKPSPSSASRTIYTSARARCRTLSANNSRCIFAITFTACDSPMRRNSSKTINIPSRKSPRRSVFLPYAPLIAPF